MSSITLMYNFQRQMTGTDRTSDTAC